MRAWIAGRRCTSADPCARAGGHRLAAFGFVRQRRKAFTLIEVIAVLVLLGLIAATIIASGPRSSAGVVTEADQLAAHLRYAQTRALGAVEPWRVEFIDSSTYRIGRVNGDFVRLPAEEGETRGMGDGVSLTAPPAEVRFDSWGRPVDNTGDPLAGDLTLTLTDGAQSIPVVVTAGTGLVQ